MNLQLSLIKEWFEMTGKKIKSEDYREITPYWCNRLLLWKGESKSKKWWSYEFFDGFNIDYTIDCIVKSPRVSFNLFSCNTMTLGYPKSTDTERILKYEHAGIEIRTGNPEWGAEPNKLYFVIKHGKQINL